MINDGNDENKYWADKVPSDVAGVALEKANHWFQEIDTNGYLDKIRVMWAAYHGAYFNDFDDAHRITFSGEQGELVNLSVNHLRNLGQHMLNMVTATRPSLQARATNTDHKSLVQARLANGLLDYYMREKRLEDYIKVAVEYAIVLGSGYIKMEWNSTSGEVYDYNEELGVEEVEGDIEFSNLSPFDVVFDVNREDNDHDWVICRSFKLRYDFMKKYPEYADKIKNLPSKADLETYHIENRYFSDTDLIPVYEFYHKRTEALPEGRYLLFLDNEVTLIDSPLPYRNLPVYRIAPSNILGTPYGYTPLFDILPIQDAINSLYSTILTNQNAFGVQNILVPRGADVGISELSGGLNIIEANTQFGPIEPLNLTQTPKEVFEYLKMLEQVAETISGVNSVTRGNPESSLKSGTALALVQSMSLQFMSGLQQSYVKMVEDVGTGLVNMLKDFASVPRVAMISGINNETYMKEFTGDDLSNVNRVIVDIGNPLARCLKEGTEILMFDGSKKKVEDIEIGEMVMGPDSNPRTVENVNCGEEMMYDIYTNSKNNEQFLYGCNESHILTLRYCSDDDRYDVKKGNVIDISVKEYLKLPKRHQRLLQGFRSEIIHFESKPVDVPGYILGAWLGDGHAATTALTTMDDEILNEWTNYAESIGMNVRISTNNNSGKASIYFITSGQSHGKSDRNPFMNELRLMELINNKHIPSVYLKNDESTRLELLAGLIDTDGSKIDETFVITQKNDRLSEDIVYLARSLGFKVTSRKINSQGGPGSDRSVIGEVNKITIGGNTHRIPTRLERKQAQKKYKARNWLNYGINIKENGFGKYYGFTLKEEPHFLLGDFTVTHNTTAGRVEMAEQFLQMGLITTPEQYELVLSTGKLSVMTENTQDELLTIRKENENLVSGDPVIAIATDQHAMHIREHKGVLADPQLRFDPDLVGRTLAHIQEHIDMLRNTNPDLLNIISEQPLGPAGGSPANQPPPGVNTTPMEQGMAPEMAAPPAAPQPGDVGMPPMPNPPAPFENAPVSPDDMLPPQR